MSNISSSSFENACLRFPGGNLVVTREMQEQTLHQGGTAQQPRAPKTLVGGNISDYIVGTPSALPLAEFRSGVPRGKALR